jgi:hypothetical protein
MQHRARREEQQALEKGVVERVIQDRGQRDRREQRLAVRLEEDDEADAGDDDPDVLDRRIREEALHVGLHRGEDHAEERGEKSQRQRDHAPPPELAAEQVERDAQQPVDRHLQHRAAHQRRDRRRRRRMRLGQPDVQRQETRLCAEAQERQEERNRRPDARKRQRAHRPERVVAAASLEHAEAQQDRDRADVRDDEIEKARAADLRNPVLGRDEKVGGEGHRLPCDHEHVGVVGDEYQRHRREERVVLHRDEAGRRALARAEVARREQRYRGRRRAEQQQEERRQRVDAQVERKIGKSERQHRRLRRVSYGIARDHGEHDGDRGARGKEDTADEVKIARPQESGGADRKPRGDRGDDRRAASESSLRRRAQPGRSARGGEPSRSLYAHSGCAPESGESRKMPGESPERCENILRKPNFIFRGAKIRDDGRQPPTSSSGLYAT